MAYEDQQAEIVALKFWPLLQGNLWHATSLIGARAILDQGTIRHERELAHYRISHCRSQDGISLFDFTESLEDIASQYDNWCGWFGSQSHLKGKAVVWWRLDRVALAGAIKSVKDTMIQWREAGYAQMIPYVEVCHRGSIPASAITGALVISAVRREQFQFFEAGSYCWPDIERFVGTLPELSPPSDFELAHRAIAQRQLPEPHKT